MKERKRKKGDRKEGKEGRREGEKGGAGEKGERRENSFQGSFSQSKMLFSENNQGGPARLKMERALGKRIK